MRASKTVRSQESRVMSQKEIHISGAEGIYENAETAKTVKEYVERALTHPRGKPDRITLSLEEIKQEIKRAPLLPVTTLSCDSPEQAETIITQTLSNIGISKKAIRQALKIIRSQNIMRGASLILKESGSRMEPDKSRGVRVSRLGIEKTSHKKLAQNLSRLHINTTTVKEALILASKVASCPDVIAEVCISDDPDYTTGYIASKELGYLRIPGIKNQGEMHGGRVFFLHENTDIDRLIDYLEKKPVLVC